MTVVSISHGIPTSRQRLTWGRLRRHLRRAYNNAVTAYHERRERCIELRLVGVPAPWPTFPSHPYRRDIQRPTAHLAYRHVHASSAA